MALTKRIISQFHSFSLFHFVLVEEAERQRIALTEKYDSQVKALRQELAQLRGQLEAEKQAAAVALQEGELTRQEDAKNAEARSEEVVHSLRREMEVFNCFALAQNDSYSSRVVLRKKDH